MSADPAALQALAVRTKVHLRYFELVKFTAAGHNVTCFLAVGKHALFLVRRNLGGLYPNDKGGEIYFAFISSMVEDSDNATDLLLLLSESGALAWKSEKLFVSCENRHALAQRIQVAWNTDYIFRFGQVRHLHLTKQSFGGERDCDKKLFLTVKPFKGCKEVLHSAYRFFIPESYKDQDHAGHFQDHERLCELEIGVQEPVSIADLEAANHNHIRWAGLEYKQSITLSLRDVVVTKSKSFLKRMNLMNDLCAWSGWEITLRSEDSVMAIVLLRRQYVPPLADAAQDFVIRVTCQRWAVDEGKIDEEVLLHEARLIADSTMPNTPHCTVPQQMYQDFIQAKLDTLLLPECALAWTEKSLNLKPSCEQEARMFLKCILKVMHEEHQLPSSAMLDEIGEEIPLLISPLEAANQAKMIPNLEEDQPEGNAWMARVARYFTYCLDGAFFSDFTLEQICNANLTVKLHRQKVHEALLFLLHARPKDVSKKWELKEIRHLILNPELFETYEFNNHALQAFLEFGWLARQLKPPKGEEKISLDFSQFLCALLVSEDSSQDLKAAICRTFGWACSGPIHASVLVPALTCILKRRNIFLKTCATVALVNMTSNHEPVKDVLIQMDVHAILVEHLGLRDDDLIYYTLMLTKNLSRTTAQRMALKKCGGVSELVTLLRMLVTMPQKHQLIAELASNIGQLCNEEDIMMSMAEAKVVQRLIALYELSPENSRLRAKLMFALRQFCSGTSGESFRQEVGVLLPTVIEELGAVAVGKPFDSLTSDQTDCLVSAVLLLFTLSISPTLLEEMREQGFIDILLKLRFSPLKELDVTRERIVELWELLKGEEPK